MKPFAFLKSTPKWAKENNCGQFNGYIAFSYDDACKLKLFAHDYNEDGDYEGTTYYFPYNNEITYCDTISFVELGNIRPISEITQEAIDCNRLFVVGFDTCHIDNSWEKDTYDSVKKETLDWLNQVLTELGDLLRY